MVLMLHAPAVTVLPIVMVPFMTLRGKTMGEMRVRSEGPIEQRVTTEKYLIGTNGSRSQIDSKELVTYRFSKSITDTVTKNYAKRVAAGEIINNPMYMEVREFEADLGGYYHATIDASGAVYENRTGSTTLYEMSLPTASSEEPDMPEIDVDLMVRQAKAYAISNMNPPDYKFGEDLFELGETLRFLRNPAKSILSLSKDFARKERKLSRKLKQTADIVDGVSDLYLEYQFGVQPLLRSSLDAIENFNRNRAVARPTRSNARGFANDAGSVNGTFRKYFNPVTFDTYDCEKIHTVKVKASILYDILLPTNDLQMNLGLRPSDFPETMWAIVPFSFLVDRVVDISTAIRGATNLSQPHLRVLAASVTIRDEEKSSIQFTDQKNVGATVSVQGDVVRDKRFVYNRQIWHPSYSDVRPPSQIGGLVKNAQYITDLTALASKMLRPLVKKYVFLDDQTALRARSR